MSRRPAVLTFVEPDADALGNAAIELVRGGTRKLVLIPWNETARSVAARLARQCPEALVFASASEPGATPAGVPAAPLDDAEAAIVTDAGAADEILLQFIDRLHLHVVAPRTSRFYRSKPLFLISIPKSGTHLLYKLAETFGYDSGIFAGNVVRPGAWYCLEYSNSHTVARDFFVDTVRRSPFGNRHHPFNASPALFMYRNPLDVLVSEANYYHRDGKTAFAGYLSGLDFEQRVERLMDDPWLLGSIRDRIGGFLPWLEFPNVIPLSFEELIGPEGGGGREDQLRLIWSLQLKLHVPGNAASFADRVFDSSSPTFYQGRIGMHRERLTPQLMDRFRALNQDFMQALGYASGGPDAGRALRAAEFRRRPLKVSAAAHDDVPIALQYDFLGFNLVHYRDGFYAIPQGAGPAFDLRRAEPSVLARLPRARDLPELQQLLLLGAPPRLIAGGLRADQVLLRLTGEPEPGTIRFWLDQTLGRVRRALQRLWRWLTGRGWTLETGAERK